MFYSKQSFLKDIRAHQHPFGESNNLAHFAKKAVIQYKQPITMYDFIQEADSDDKRLTNTREWVQFYHDVLVTNRIDVLTRFYNSYLYTDEMETLFEEPLFKESVEELSKSLLNESE
jgi:hypothetical protein